ncbi:MAG: hypothetical protein ABIQ18_47975 [Umezawaea sp.]
MFEKLRRWASGGATPGARPVVNVVTGSAAYVVQADRIDMVVGGSSPLEVDVLLDLTRADLRAGGTAVPRPEATVLEDVDGDFLITGAPGSGKSEVLRRLAERLLSRGEDVVLLSAEALGAHRGAVSRDVTLTRPVDIVLSEWAGEVRGNFLVDGVDESAAWLADVVSGLRGSRWRSVATVRGDDLLHSSAWRQAFAGPPVSESGRHRDARFADVRHFLLGGTQVSDQL